MTSKDVILTLSAMLGAGLLAELLAGWLHIPKMLVLLAVGAILGPAVSGAIDVPLDSTGAQLLLTLGVSIILFHGGIGLSVKVLQPGRRRADAARDPRGDHHRERSSDSSPRPWSSTSRSGRES